MRILFISIFIVFPFFASAQSAYQRSDYMQAGDKVKVCLNHVDTSDARHLNDFEPGEESYDFSELFLDSLDRFDYQQMNSPQGAKADSFPEANSLIYIPGLDGVETYVLDENDKLEITGMAIDMEGLLFNIHLNEGDYLTYNEFPIDGNLDFTDQSEKHMRMTVEEMNRMILAYNEEQPDSAKLDTLNLTFDMEITTGGVDEMKLDIFISNHTQGFASGQVTDPVNKTYETWHEKKEIRIKVRPVVHIYPEYVFSQPVGGWKTLTEIKQMADDYGADLSDIPLPLDDDTIRINSNIHNWYNTTSPIPVMQAGCDETDTVLSLSFPYQWGQLDSLYTYAGGSMYHADVDEQAMTANFRFNSDVDFSDQLIHIIPGEDSSVVAPETGTYHDLSDSLAISIYDGGVKTATYYCLSSVDLKITSFSFFLDGLEDTVRATISQISNTITLRLPETVMYQSVTPQIGYSASADISPAPGSSLSLDGASKQYTLSSGNHSVIYRIEWDWYIPDGIEDTEGQATSIWPNPATGMLNISGLPDNAESLLSIYTMDGKELLSKKVRSDDQLGLGFLPPGVYYIRLQDENGQWIGIHRFVVLR